MLEQRAKNKASCASECDETRWSIERQVRIVSGLLILFSIALAYTINLNFIWVAILVSMGMVISGVTNSCALGLLIKRMPWNHSES